MYPFCRWFWMNCWTSFLSFLESRYTHALLALNSFLRSMTWSHIFLVGILSDSIFPNTFSYLWNFCGTIASTFQWSNSISSSLSQSSFSSAAHLILSISSLWTSFFPFLFFLISRPISFLPIYRPHIGGHLVILTSPFSQSISGLCVCNQGIPNITSVFPRSHTSILTLSTCPLKYRFTSTSCVIDPPLFPVPSTFRTTISFPSFINLKPPLSVHFLLIKSPVAPLSSNAFIDTPSWVSIFSTLICIHTSHRPFKVLRTSLCFFSRSVIPVPST